MDMEQFSEADASATAASWVNGRPIVSVLHLRADRDVNGNPRRVFAGIDDRGHVVAVTDEGYGGDPAWARAAAKAGLYAVSIDVPVSEYKRLVALVERNRGPWGIYGGADDGTPYTRASTLTRARRAARNGYAWAINVTIREIG